MKVLNEHTAIPLTLVIAIATFAFWLSSVSSDTKANTKAVADLQAETRGEFDHVYDFRARSDIEQGRLLREITDRLGRIEGKLDSLRQQKRD